MAFDIFGNRLRPGYCEVHPNVHEEYPCSLCYVEIEKQERVRREEFKMQQDFNRAMQEDRNRVEKYENKISEPGYKEFNEGRTDKPNLSVYYKLTSAFTLYYKGQLHLFDTGDVFRLAGFELSSFGESSPFHYLDDIIRLPNSILKKVEK